MKYVFHPEAKVEYAEAVRFYNAIQSSLGQEFIDAVENAIFRVVQFPKRWTMLDRGVRRCLTRQFPYGILYRIESDYILIVAVMHCNRKPGYWKERLH